MRVLLANAPLAYRQVISMALREIRPHFEIFAIEPELLHVELTRLSPQLVVCSHVTDLVDRETLAWIELYPDNAAESFVSLAGERTTHPNMDFVALLGVLDETERLLASEG